MNFLKIFIKSIIETIILMGKNKVLQVGLITGFIVILFPLIDHIPNDDYFFAGIYLNSSILSQILWIIVLLGIVTLIPLAISEFTKNESISKKAENAYYKMIRFTADISIALSVLLVGLTLAIYSGTFIISFIVPIFNQNIVSFIKSQPGYVTLLLLIIICSSIFIVLNKKGLKLFENG